VVRIVDQPGFGEEVAGFDGVTDKATAERQSDFKVADVWFQAMVPHGLRSRPRLGQRRRKRTGITRNLPPRGRSSPPVVLTENDLCLACENVVACSIKLGSAVVIHHLAKHGAFLPILLCCCKMDKSPRSASALIGCLRSYDSHLP